MHLACDVPKHCLILGAQGLSSIMMPLKYQQCTYGVIQDAVGGKSTSNLVGHGRRIKISWADAHNDLRTSTNKGLNMNPRKYPRTLQEAFGPYTSNQIDSPPTPMDYADTIVLLGSIIALVVIIIFAIFGVIK
jgi:hypothetical protein